MTNSFLMWQIKSLSTKYNTALHVNALVSLSRTRKKTTTVQPDEISHRTRLATQIMTGGDLFSERGGLICMGSYPPRKTAEIKLITSEFDMFCCPVEWSGLEMFHFSTAKDSDVNNHRHSSRAWTISLMSYLCRKGFLSSVGGMFEAFKDGRP